MNAKTRLKKVLKKARKTLLKNKSIATTFCILSKNTEIAPIIIHPHWYNETDKTKGFAELHKICRETEAREVLTYGEVLINEDNKPTTDGILVSIEDCTGIQSVLLPFKMNGDGKVTFGKEDWISKVEKNPGYRLEGLVQ